MKRKSSPKTNTNKRPHTSAVASPYVGSPVVADCSFPHAVTAEVCGRLYPRPPAHVLTHYRAEAEANLARLVRRTVRRGAGVPVAHSNKGSLAKS